MSKAPGHDRPGVSCLVLPESNLRQPLQKRSKMRAALGIRRSRQGQVRAYRALVLAVAAPASGVVVVTDRSPLACRFTQGRKVKPYRPAVPAM